MQFDKIMLPQIDVQKLICVQNVEWTRRAVNNNNKLLWIKAKKHVLQTVGCLYWQKGGGNLPAERIEHRRGDGIRRQGKSRRVGLGGRMCSIPFRASCFASVDLKEKDEFNRFFQIDQLNSTVSSKYTKAKQL